MTTEEYARTLTKVLARLKKSMVNILAGSQGATEMITARAWLESGPAMVAALEEAGYFELSAQYLKDFDQVPAQVKSLISKAGGPAFTFSPADREAMRQIAAIDLTRFGQIGTDALNELRYVISSDIIAGTPFNELVEGIAAQIDGPLANHSYTYANTAIGEFEGKVAQQAGEELGFTGDDSLWEVVGVLDSVTREVCQSALANPVRTKQEWIDAGYWGGSPGGWNCRHILIPFFGEDAGQLEEAETINLAGVDNNDKDGILKALGTTTKQQQKLIEKLPKPKQVTLPEREGEAYYNRARRQLAADAKHRGGAVMVHEYGHHVDFELSEFSSLSKSSTDEVFGKAIETDRKSLGLHSTKTRGAVMDRFKSELYDTEEVFFGKQGNSYMKDTEKTQSGTMISDIVDAMTTGQFQKTRYAHGHGVGYYRKAGAKAQETFANMFAVRGEKEWSYVVQNFPETAKRFDEIIAEAL